MKLLILKILNFKSQIKLTYSISFKLNLKKLFYTYIFIYIYYMIIGMFERY